MNEPTEILTEEQIRQIYSKNSVILPSAKLPFNSSQLKGDLDNIVLMALRKESDRRYASVEDLSKDISNYLNGLPVSARPNTFFYRASKFYSRNKTASIIGILLALSLIFGIIATSWQSIIARQQRDRAENRFNDVRKLSNSLLFEITPNIENLNGSTKAREILVKRALEYLDSLANESQDDTQLQSELASAYEKVGELQANPNKSSLNDLVGAIESYQKAQNIRLKLPSTLENQKGLAENFRRYGDVVYAQNDVQNSLEATKNALEIYQRLSAENPQQIDLQTSFIQTRLDYAATYSSNNQYGEAIPIFQKTIAELAVLDQNNKEVQRISSLALAQLSNALSWNNRQPEAEIEMAKAIKIAEDLLNKYPNDSLIKLNTFRIYSLASGIYEEVKNDISLEFAQKALQMATRSVEADAGDLLAKASQARAFSRVGISLVNVEKISTAIENLEKAENLFRELMAQEPRNLSYQRNLAILHLRIGDAQTLQTNYSEALDSYQKSANLFNDLAKMDEKNTLARRDEAQSLKNVGAMQIRLNQIPQAKKTFQKALEILKNLQSQNALGEIDQKMIIEMQTTLLKLEN